MSKPIPGFPGYTISKNGTVKNDSGKIVRPRKDDDGYDRVDLYKDGKRSTRFVHTLVVAAYKGGNSETVDHKNNDRDDNSVSNLEGVSDSENKSRRHKREN